MVLFSKVMNCLESMLPIEIGIAPTTIKPTFDSDNGNGDTTTSTTTTSTTTTTKQASAGCVGPYENIKWKSGGIKNSVWQDGSGYKFNRHIYIPLIGKYYSNLQIQFMTLKCGLSKLIKLIKMVDCGNSNLWTDSQRVLQKILGCSTSSENQFDLAVILKSCFVYLINRLLLLLFRRLERFRRRLLQQLNRLLNPRLPNR